MRTKQEALDKISELERATSQRGQNQELLRAKELEIENKYGAELDARTKKVEELTHQLKAEKEAFANLEQLHNELFDRYNALDSDTKSALALKIALQDFLTNKGQNTIQLNNIDQNIILTDTEPETITISTKEDHGKILYALLKIGGLASKEQILSFLTEHGKALPEGRFRPTMEALVDGGRVVKEGDRVTTRYRLPQFAKFEEEKKE
ncbi:MAG: hypothetical protein KGN01_06435 [Patescibacteria group bacterium]|nr:hypothetical protein [Patescibacteria group bacterium]